MVQQTEKEMNEGIPPFLDRRQLVYSFSMLNAYRSVCPQQMFQTYIARTIPYEETPERKKGNDLHKAMEMRVPGGKPLPDGMQQYETFAAAFDGRNAISEPELAITRYRQPCGYWDDKIQDPHKRVFLRGRADVVVVGDETAYLADWKTGNDNIKYEDPFELAVQALLLQAKAPQMKRIVGQYIWLKTMRLSQMYDLSDTDATWNTVNQLVQSIEADRARGVFEKKRSGLCGYCGHKECENWRPRNV